MFFNNTLLKTNKREYLLYTLFTIDRQLVMEFYTTTECTGIMLFFIPKVYTNIFISNLSCDRYFLVGYRKCKLNTVK